MTTPNLIQKAAALIRDSQNITVLTGAGVSRESGIPTFRDALDGLWARFNPQELATASAFMDNPKLVWDFYEYRRDIMRDKSPNAGHFALAELQRRSPSLVVITQNIDELHEQGGSTGVIHLHGRIAGNKCFYNCQGDPTMVDVSLLSWDKENGPPACPHCGRWVRPDVVWFGEMLPPAALNAAADALQVSELMLVIGTSGLVMPAADMPMVIKRRGGKVIEINPDDTPISDIADIKLSGPSGEILPRIVEALDAE